MASTQAEHGCIGCAADLEHCHGTLLTHVDGTSECTDQACADLDPARHSLTAGCAELDHCGCAEAAAADLAVAS